MLPQVKLPPSSLVTTRVSLPESGKAFWVTTSSMPASWALEVAPPQPEATNAGKRTRSLRCHMLIHEAYPCREHRGPLEFKRTTKGERRAESDYEEVSAQRQRTQACVRRWRPAVFGEAGSARTPFLWAAFHERSAETRGNSQNHVTQRNAKERGVTAQEATGRQRDGASLAMLHRQVPDATARSSRSLEPGPRKTQRGALGPTVSRQEAHGFTALRVVTGE